jgi:hypothetical protein
MEQVSHPILILLLKMPRYLGIQSIGRIAQTCKDIAERCIVDDVWRWWIIPIIQQYPQMEAEFAKIPSRENRCYYTVKTCLDPFRSEEKCWIALNDPIYAWWPQTTPIKGDTDFLPEPAELAFREYQIEGVEPKVNIRLAILRILITNLVRFQMDTRIKVLHCYRVGYNVRGFCYAGGFIIRIPPRLTTDEPIDYFSNDESDPIKYHESQVVDYDSDYDELYDVEQGCHSGIVFSMDQNVTFCRNFIE